MVWTWRVFLSLKVLITLALCILLQSCTTITPPSSKYNVQTNCAPKTTFRPSTVNITSSGVFSFLAKKQNFNYDLKNAKWVCKTPDNRVVNKFDQVDAEFILEAIISKKDRSSDVITKDVKLAPKTEFRSYVTIQCDLLGLSYLFELEAGPNKKIIGCQITVSANSAIMWKKLDSAFSVQVAYLPIYQPFINQFLNSI